MTTSLDHEALVVKRADAEAASSEWPVTEAGKSDDVTAPDPKRAAA